MINSDKILFIPSLRKGNGTGHLKRCLEWGENFKTINIFILQNNNEELLDYTNHPLCRSRDNILWHKDIGTQWELIILDNRSSDEIPSAFKGIPLIAVDESGMIREKASYVMDTLPSNTKKMMNTMGYRFLKRNYLPHSPESLKRILVSFGGEDSAGLGNKIWQVFETEKLSDFIKKSNIQIDIILPLSRNTVPRASEGITILPYIHDLSDNLGNYDLIICQFGMTTFEALSSKRYIFLLNPSTYHDDLSLNNGLPYQSRAVSLSNEKLSDILIEKINDISKLDKTTINRHLKLWEKYSEKQEDIKPWLSTMNISMDICPVCLSSNRNALARFEQKSIFKCRDCSMKYMVQFRVKENIYNKDYFFSDYKKQYGKTYIDDFSHIRKMGLKRLEYIGKMNPQKGCLLDIGCAYGPFLSAAAQWGYEAFGLEISEEAVNYVKTNFKDIKILQGDLNNKKIQNLLKKEEYQVITLWYVIEHFSSLHDILPFLASLLKKGGVLALATPYASGVSGLFSSQHFYSSSPEDHYTLWDRKSAAYCLRQAGFKNIRFVSTGHHPERFSPIIKKIVPMAFLLFISRLMAWGDTFEIYAQKG